MFGDGESKLSLLDLSGEGGDEAALHLMPNVQVRNCCQIKQKKRTDLKYDP